MKLVLYNMENSEIEFEDGVALSVECDDRDLFARYVRASKGWAENDLAIVEDLERLDLSTSALTVLDHFGYAGLVKPLLNKFYKSIEKFHAGDEDVLRKLSDINGHISEFVALLVEDCSVETDMASDFSITDILKFADVGPRMGDGPFRDMLTFLEFVSALRIYKVLILVNAKSYFSFDEIGSVMRTCAHLGQPLLLLDDKTDKRLHENEKKLLIDEELYDMILM